MRSGRSQLVGQVLAEARAVAERERPAELAGLEEAEPRPNSPEDVGYMEGQSHDPGAGKAGAPNPSPGAAGQQGRREPLSPAGAPPVGRCTSCGASVFWAVTGTGARMPVDTEVREDGNIQLHWNGQRILAVYLTGDLSKFPGPRRAPHTCGSPSR